jgi:hypothetical protein
MPLITSAGAVPYSPAVLNAQLLDGAVAQAPGLTATLPGALIEDLSSTGTGALVVQDQAAADLLNGVSPLTANEFILYQLGGVYGVRRGIGSNTSVYVVFSGSPGFVINRGFIVSDGTHQYVTQDPAIISGPGPIGSSAATFCLAVDAGTWAVPSGTVIDKVTSVPSAITLTFTNPATGIPGGDPQTLADYQAQVIQAGLAVATGTPAFLKTQVENVYGVQPRLVSMRQTGGGWQIIVGGGDPYQVAGAIYQALFNIQDLQAATTMGSTQTIAINDYPNTYEIVFVVPAQQSVGMTVTWNTVATANFVSEAIVIALVQPAIVAYINSITVGEPISVLTLQDTFIKAVAGSIPEEAISKLQFIVTIDGDVVNPPTGGTLIAGDPESFFFAESSDISVVQG